MLAGAPFSQKVSRNCSRACGRARYHPRGSIRFMGLLLAMLNRFRIRIFSKIRSRLLITCRFGSIRSEGPPAGWRCAPDYDDARFDHELRLLAPARGIQRGIGVGINCAPRQSSRRTIEVSRPLICRRLGSIAFAHCVVSRSAAGAAKAASWLNTRRCPISAFFPTR